MNKNFLSRSEFERRMRIYRFYNNHEYEFRMLKPKMYKEFKKQEKDGHFFELWLFNKILNGEI